jgi:hypothetical protein
MVTRVLFLSSISTPAAAAFAVVEWVDAAGIDIVVAGDAADEVLAADSWRRVRIRKKGR